MGVYLSAGTAPGNVKVSGQLTAVVPVGTAPFGSMSADEFLSRLSEVEDVFYSSAEWRETVASGAAAQLDEQAATSSFVVPASGPSACWFQERKLRAARALAEQAAEAGSPVNWG